VSYDLVLLPTAGPLDVDRARDAFRIAEGEGEELVWEAQALTATILLTPAEIGIGVSGEDAPAAERARDFAALLDAILEAAAVTRARVHDPQLGRDLGRGDIADAVAQFA